MTDQVTSTLERDADAADEVRAVDIPAVSTARGTTPEQVNSAVEMLREHLGKLKGLGSVIRIDFGDGKPIYVDCDAGALVDASTAASGMMIHPDDLRRVISGALDPRSGVLFSIIRVTGDIASITRFCDRLCGRNSQTAMDGTPALPVPTTDIDQVKRDLAEFGYGLVKDALSPQQVAEVRQRLIDQAKAEADAGVAWFDGKAGSDNPPNQRVWNLVNKGQPFIDVLNNPIVDQLVPDVLGDNYILSNYLGNIAGPGGDPQFLHTDQIGVQPEINAFPVGLNFLWFLDDIHEDNGGTRLFPGSHLTHIAPENPFVSDGTTFASGPAGTALVFETRLWHGTGANVTDKNRHVVISLFYRSWMRAQINPEISIHPDVAATFDERMQVLHGFRCTSTHGGREDQIEGEFNRHDPETLVREMQPAS